MCMFVHQHPASTGPVPLKWKVILMTPVYICGHKNPDTDSVCSTYCYARLKNRIAGTEQTRAIRCGPLNQQTSYIFKKAGLTPPEFVKNIWPSCADVMNARPDVVKQGAPLDEVFHLLDEKHLNAVPVIDAADHFLGLVNLNMLTKRFLGFGHGRTEIIFNPDNVSRVLGQPALVRGEKAGGAFSLIIGAFPFEEFCTRLDALPVDRVVLMVGDRPDLIEYALAQRVAILILTGIRDPAAAATRFRNSSAWVFASPFDTIETYRRLMLSMPVESVMSSESPVLGPDSRIAEASAILADHAVRGIPIIADEQFVGLITRTDLLNPQPKQLILMDHNEISQAIDGAEMAEILEVVDHHRLGALTTSLPIHFYAKPVGSTCTLVFEKYRLQGIQPSPAEAMLLLSGILSDTLALRSPTATNDDREALEALSVLAGVADWKAFAADLFSNTCNLLFGNLTELVKADLKIYHEHGVAVGIAQIEVVDMDEADEVRQRLAVEVEKLRQTQALDWAMLLVTDIIHTNSRLITTGLEKADQQLKYARMEKGYFLLPGVLSRKKQLLPEVLRVIERQARGKEG